MSRSQFTENKNLLWFIVFYQSSQRKLYDKSCLRLRINEAVVIYGVRKTKIYFVLLFLYYFHITIKKRQLSVVWPERQFLSVNFLCDPPELLTLYKIMQLIFFKNIAKICNRALILCFKIKQFLFNWRYGHNFESYVPFSWNYC